MQAFIPLLSESVGNVCGWIFEVRTLAAFALYTVIFVKTRKISVSILSILLQRIVQNRLKRIQF